MVRAHRTCPAVLTHVPGSANPRAASDVGAAGSLLRSDCPPASRLTDVNPAGTVPVAKDVDHFIVDSDTICDYLEEKYAPDKEITKRVLGKIAEVPNP